ncbi:MAG: hypothetical protein QGG71_07625 [Pirellulaceae bacterium]|nr:hypothetical protein [Pirellulaceae bacterium]
MAAQDALHPKRYAQFEFSSDCDALGFVFKLQLMKLVITNGCSPTSSL